MTMLPEFNDYLVFADEAGDHSLSPLDENFPIFVLTFCVVEKYHYADFIVRQMMRLKLKYFPEKTKGLRHSPEAYRRPVFASPKITIAQMRKNIRESASAQQEATH